MAVSVLVVEMSINKIIQALPDIDIGSSSSLLTYCSITIIIPLSGNLPIYLSLLYSTVAPPSFLPCLPSLSFFFLHAAHRAVRRSEQKHDISPPPHVPRYPLAVTLLPVSYDLITHYLLPYDPMTKTNKHPIN